MTRTAIHSEGKRIKNKRFNDVWKGKVADLFQIKNPVKRFKMRRILNEMFDLGLITKIGKGLVLFRPKLPEYSKQLLKEGRPDEMVLTSEVENEELNESADEHSNLGTFSETEY